MEFDEANTANDTAGTVMHDRSVVNDRHLQVRPPVLYSHAMSAGRASPRGARMNQL